MKKALIFQGGWDGHEPKLTSKRFAGMLEKNGIQAEIYDDHACFADFEKLLTYDLIECGPIYFIKRFFRKLLKKTDGCVLYPPGSLHCYC